MNFSLTVPLLFYDLIARVVPGATFIVGFYIINNDIKGLIPSDGLGGFSLLLILVLLSYVMGFILTSIYLLVTEKCPKKFLLTFSKFLASKEQMGIYPPIVEQTINSVLSEKYGDLDKLSDKQINRIYDITSDWIRLRKPELGSILLKLNAEGRMLDNLLIAFTLLAGLSIFYKLSLLPFFLILAFLSFDHLKRHNTKRLMRWVNNIYVLHKIEAETPKTTQST